MPEKTLGQVAYESFYHGTSLQRGWGLLDVYAKNMWDCSASAVVDHHLDMMRKNNISVISEPPQSAKEPEEKSFADRIVEYANTPKEHCDCIICRNRRRMEADRESKNATGPG